VYILYSYLHMHTHTSIINQTTIVSFCIPIVLPIVLTWIVVLWKDYTLKIFVVAKTKHHIILDR